MKISKILISATIVLVSSQALAENWIVLGSMGQGTSFSVDKDSIRRGSDGLVRFTTNNSLLGKGDEAADCQKRLTYAVGDHGHEYANWRDHGRAIKAGSIGEIDLQYVCANSR